MGHAYGRLPDAPDERDHPWASTPHGQKALAVTRPRAVDLEPLMPPVYDQGQLGSCVANGTGAALEFEESQQFEGATSPSRLFIYYEGRRLEGTVSEDSGLQVRDGVKVVANSGAPPETDWPYDIAQFTKRPPNGAYIDAAKHKAIEYARLTPNGQIRACLAAGKPVVFGFDVYDSFESQEVADSGVVPMPEPGESVLGGHCMLLVGYDNSTRRVKARNSWGSEWGKAGYCWMPYEMFTSATDSIASDFWTIRKTT